MATAWVGIATLSLAAWVYLGMTFDSARRHWRNEGASWKGRAAAGRRRAEWATPAQFIATS